MSSEYTELLRNLGTDTIAPEVLAKLTQIGGTTYDQLTGLMDYRTFSIKAKTKLNELKSAVIVSISIDFLQEINFLSGWVVGDITLCSVANILKNPPGVGSFTAKVSGGTFVSLLNITEINEAKQWFQNIQTKVAKIELPGLDMLPDEHLTISGGMFKVNAEKDSIDSVLLEVKKRLQHAQNSGGNKISSTATDSIDLAKKKIIDNCVVKKQNSKDKQQVNIIQLNPHGLSFEAIVPYMVREQILITIQFGENRARFKGEIAWRRTSNSEAKYPFNIGVKFNEVNNEQKNMLELLMA